MTSENHDSELYYTIPLECGIIECHEEPEWRMAGYLHFTFEDHHYSQDRMELCDDHREAIEELIAPEARESRLERNTVEEI